ncbi:4a-hydroxytetrahydrobiopterin dehydratase [Leptospira congkakensis]|uniref:4a-hydroxytetrahydrobiopterin dehydratase n=1 Tax=Leptospira congkakensis TaxID=2484932 RepID=A0A4Z1A201_9LEPT|nr:4a-hydroxytetrahydrobiopterin dehydratase [Leptospira congkakensis]TGL87710.1 4a-hydroxytetrahydrobiopterin dehydratase [Leptospira congkakensis]TGL89674.1 4a-hydroxytetrahydrobiopterin dehydratase [Leptospira congkakensis]TGL95860.1 4a-hydroxytetrahydrobiopterin dehydratase [Leptospira congkakensis]
MREKPTDLTTIEIQNLLNTYQEWKLESTEGVSFFQYEKEFRNFKEAFVFLTKLAFVSESLDHHAEIWNVYNRVRLRLFTHETNSLTTRDQNFIIQLMT